MRAARAAMLLVPALLVGAPALAQTPSARRWTHADYARFTGRRFRAWKPANRPIDFKHVDYGLLGAAIFYETNRMRLRHGRPPLRHSPALHKAAFGHARDMAEKDFHSHVNPDAPAKRTLSQRIALVGLARCRASENIAYVPARRHVLIRKRPGRAEFRIDPDHLPPPHTYITFARQVVAGWMLSPGHRKNILARDARYLGCGAYYCRKEALTSQGRKLLLDYFKVCQNFASKRGPDPK